MQVTKASFNYAHRKNHIESIDHTTQTMTSRQNTNSLSNASSPYHNCDANLMYRIDQIPSDGSTHICLSKNGVNYYHQSEGKMGVFFSNRKRYARPQLNTRHTHTLHYGQMLITCIERCRRLPLRFVHSLEGVSVSKRCGQRPLFSISATVRCGAETRSRFRLRQTFS